MGWVNMCRLYTIYACSQYAGLINHESAVHSPWDLYLSFSFYMMAFQTFVNILIFEYNFTYPQD